MDTLDVWLTSYIAQARSELEAWRSAASVMTIFLDENDAFARSLQPPTEHDMGSRESRRIFFAIEYLNGQQFVGRFNDHWTVTRDPESALLFHSEAAADNARQALLAEARTRLANTKDEWPEQMWWDFIGGVVHIVEIEQITRLRPLAPATKVDAIDPVARDSTS